MDAGQNSQVNPWVRADQERFNPETLELVRQGDRHEYVAGMQNLAHWKSVFGVVMEQLQMAEEWRHDFFERQQSNVVQLRLVTDELPPEAA